MATALIIGSEVTAPSTILALRHRENLNITFIDIGLQLDTDGARLVKALASSSPEEWDAQTIRFISKQPVASQNSGIHEKRAFGSDYPFRNIHTAPSRVGAAQVARLGVAVHAFTTGDSRVLSGGH
jgi:hypothetical protein